jgi:hypothetical protein
MTVNVSEYMNKFQQDGLTAIKETQDASIKAMNSFSELTKEWSAQPGKMPTFENIPTPTQLVELSFGFASQMLEMRKAFTLRIAEMLVETQKTAETNFNAAASNPNKPVIK